MSKDIHPAIIELKKRSDQLRADLSTKLGMKPETINSCFADLAMVGMRHDPMVLFACLHLMVADMTAMVELATADDSGDDGDE